VRAYGTSVMIVESNILANRLSDDEVTSPERAIEALVGSNRSVGFSGDCVSFTGARPSAAHVGPH
jgi:hypothetical protein